jgi:pimeloyl-ACP methyl ester carboxylesterase
MPHANLNGAHIHFTDSGGDGEVIIFSHGLLFSGEMFEAQVAHFRDCYRCITFDHRGQGKSGVTETGYDIDTLTCDAMALIEHLNAGPCHFVGLSMGGFVGMRLAANNPHLIKSLTLLDTSAELEPKRNIPKYRLLNLVARWLGLRMVIGQVMPIMFGQTFLKDMSRLQQQQLWKNAIIGNDRIGITRAVKGVIDRQGCFDLLGKIKLPVGIGVGDEDVATTSDKSDRMHQAIIGSQLVLFKGAGHSSTIETPDQVNSLIEQTIQR